MKASEVDDETLMQQVVRGSQEPMEALLRRHAAPLLTFLCRMTGDRHLAEELFQEVFLAVWQKRATYRYPRPFRPWLYAIAANKVRQAYRKVRQAPATLPLASSDDPASGDNPVQSASNAETATLLVQAVQRLPLQQRTVLVLRIWENMPYADIARVLGRDEGTVRSHMHHGLSTLRRWLASRWCD
jgi:RNA polymerase sigma-70 factor (ECF subfamily)